jgi:hypothetical protein
MKRFSCALVGCVGGLIIGLGLASCVAMASADEVPGEPVISHRKILSNTCFYSTNTAREISTLSCVKD